MGRRSSICVGDKFGRLTVVKKTKFKYFNSSVWECTCDCGNKVVVSSGALSSGNTLSCGCLRKEWASVRTICCSSTHDATGYRGVYYNPKCNSYFAKLTNNGHTYNLGSYKMITDAIKARRRAEEEYHFPRIEAYERMRAGV